MHLIKTLSLVLVLSIIGVPAYSQHVDNYPVQTKQLAYTVKYKDGTLEHYLATWNGTVRNEWHEDGHPAEPLNGWFTDTRQCHWMITGEIVRQVSLINKLGQQFNESVLSKTYNSQMMNKGTDLNVLTLSPGNCGSTQARMSSDVSGVEQRLLKVFPTITATDLADLRKNVSSNAEVIRVKSQ